MAKSCSFVLLAVLLSLSLSVARFETSYAKDKKPTGEEIAAKHLESIGTPEVLAGIKSRSATGIATVRRPIGTVPLILPEPGTRTDDSNLLIASAGNNLGMVMKFYNREYVSEHFGIDGKNVTTDYIYGNRKSILGIFIDQNKGLLKEGFLGGTLSTAWPLLNIAERKCKLQYEAKDYSGVKLHQLTYIPKSRMNLDKIVVHMFFDFESYRHLMTEYLYMGLVHAEIIVLEKFGSFRTVDGLTLPHSYSIEYNVWQGQKPTLWSFEVRQILHNGPIDPEVFHVK
jgi:hypothetical protein